MQVQDKPIVLSAAETGKLLNTEVQLTMGMLVGVGRSPGWGGKIDLAEVVWYNMGKDGRVLKMAFKHAVKLILAFRANAICRGADCEHLLGGKIMGPEDDDLVEEALRFLNDPENAEVVEDSFWDYIMRVGATRDLKAKPVCVGLAVKEVVAAALDPFMVSP